MACQCETCCEVLLSLAQAAHMLVWLGKSLLCLPISSGFLSLLQRNESFHLWSQNFKQGSTL